MTLQKQTQLYVNAALRNGKFKLNVRHCFNSNDITAITGPEGCGKTTLLRLLSGWLKPDHGCIAIGKQIWSNNKLHIPPHKRNIAMVFQDRRLIEHLTVEGNLHFAAHHRRTNTLGPDHRELVNAFALNSLLKQPVSLISGGERLRVALAQSLLAWPRLLLLDEAFAGLSRRSRAVVLPYLKKMSRRHNTGIIMATHDPDDILDLAQNAAVMHDGQITHTGTPAQIASLIDAPWQNSPNTTQNNTTT